MKKGLGAEHRPHGVARGHEGRFFAKALLGLGPGPVVEGDASAGELVEKVTDDGALEGGPAFVVGAGSPSGAGHEPP